MPRPDRHDFLGIVNCIDMDFCLVPAYTDRWHVQTSGRHGCLGGGRIVRLSLPCYTEPTERSQALAEVLGDVYEPSENITEAALVLVRHFVDRGQLYHCRESLRKGWRLDDEVLHHNWYSGRDMSNLVYSVEYVAVDRGLDTALDWEVWSARMTGIIQMCAEFCARNKTALGSQNMWKNIAKMQNTDYEIKFWGCGNGILKCRLCSHILRYQFQSISANPDWKATKSYHSIKICVTMGFRGGYSWQKSPDLLRHGLHAESDVGIAA